MTGLSLYTNSVAPVTALALTHSTVKVSWYLPNPVTYKAIRLVRNQYAFSENQEDGEILYEFNNAANSGLGTVTVFTDGADTSLSSVALVSGQYAYYTIWLLINDLWVNAGTSSVLIPKQHSTYANNTVSLKSTHMKVMELLPRVYTSSSNSPFDAVDKTSDLYKFMRGIALTYDEILTYADLTVRSLPAKFIPDSMVLNAFSHLGLRITSTAPTIYKKNLISKAPYLLATKGTKKALTNFVETFTGFNTTVSDTTNPTSNSVSLTSSNLLLTAQDSSFHKGGVGSWLTVSNATLTADPSTDIPTTDQYSFKSPYRLKVVTLNNGIDTQFKLGSSSVGSSLYGVLSNAIPVEPGQSYSFSFMGKQGTGTLALVPFITWYDAYGIATGTTVNGSSTALTSSWARTTLTATAPGAKWTATSYTVGTSVTNTKITTSTAHGLSSGDKVYFEDEYLPFTGVYTVGTGTSGTDIYIPYYQNAATLTSVSSSINGSVYTFTLGSGTTKYVRVGQTVTITSGTGTLGGVTKVLAVTGSTTFTVDVQPSVALSGATVSVSTFTVTRDFTVFKANSGGTNKETPAEYAFVGIKQTVRASTFYLTSFQFCKSSYSGFVEARCVDVYVEPTKINYLIDPTFAATVYGASSGWSSPGGALTYAENSTLTGVPYCSSSKMAKLVTSASSTTAATPDIKTASPTPITNNNSYYTFSVYIKGDAAYTLKLGLTQAVGGSVFKEVDIAVTTDWKRFSVTLYVTSIAAGLTPYIYGTRSAAATIRLDDAQLEQSQKTTDYFDGSFINQGAQWAGQSSASKSYLYVNKDQKISELSIHMNDWVPLNMTWMVRSLSGIEAIGIPYTSTVSSSTSSGYRGGGRGSLVAL
jgi:hypothetical protein